MKRFWLVFFVLFASVQAWAANGFDLQIEAPDEVKQLLTRHLELQRYQELTDLSDDELDRLQNEAEHDARQLLGTLGYFAPNIVIQRQTKHSTDASNRLIRIQVSPGEPTRVTQVKIQFMGAIASDANNITNVRLRNQIQTSWTLPARQRFTQTAWDSAKQNALRLLTNAHYPQGRISQTLANIDPEHHQAQLHITLDSGPAFHTGALVIEGLQRYTPELVHNLLRLPSGTPYSQVMLVQAQQRLSDSGYFDSAFVALDTEATPDAASVLVRLRETPLQKMVFGIGASTDSGPRLSIEHTHHDVPGLHWQAVSKAQLDRDSRAFGSELTSQPDADSWRWVGSGLIKKEQLGTLHVTSQQLRGGRRQSSARIDRNLFLQYDRAESASTNTTVPELAQSLSANYAFAVRHYNSLPLPTAGWGWGAEVGGGGTLESQPQVYTRLLTRGQGFVGLGQAGRLSIRATLGAVLAQKGIALPSTQLFLAGGDNSVRGYGLYDIGVQLADGSTTAGRYLSVGSIEWQHPIRLNGQPSDWENTVFVDAGAVANQPADLSAKVGVGAGARWHSPVGPLQIDLAYGVDVRRFRLHLNLGFTF